MRKLMKELIDLNGQYESVTGQSFYYIRDAYKEGGNTAFNDDSPAGRALQALLNDAKESAALNLLALKEDDLIDQVMFAGAPSDLKDIADSIGPILASIVPKVRLLKAAE